MKLVNAVYVLNITKVYDDFEKESFLQEDMASSVPSL